MVAITVRGDERGHARGAVRVRARALAAFPFPCACVVYSARKRNNTTSIVTKINYACKISILFCPSPLRIASHTFQSDYEGYGELTLDLLETVTLVYC